MNEVDILDEVTSLSDDEYFEERLSIDIVLLNETFGVDFSPSSLKELFDEDTKDSSRNFELVRSYSNS